MDKRRYLSRTNNRKDKPTFPTNDPDLARDGYSVRSRQPAERRGSPFAWGRSDAIAPSLKDEDEAAFDSYLKD